MTAVARLSAKHGLTESDLVASTVDSWQGQTNGITVAVHPLNGASELDEFNSAFGRLAVTCTRATHGLLMVARPGLDRLLQEAPARPGTPFGEPGQPPPSAPDSPAHPRLVRAGHSHRSPGPSEGIRPMSRLNDLIRQVANTDARLAKDFSERRTHSRTGAPLD